MSDFNQDSALAQLEQQKKRIEQLSARRTRLQVQLETAREQYNAASQEAIKNYGTADLNELRTMLQNQIAANNAAVKNYLEAVDEFERFISRIEDALTNPEALTALVASMPNSDQTPDQTALPPVLISDLTEKTEAIVSPDFDEEDI